MDPSDPIDIAFRVYAEPRDNGKRRRAGAQTPGARSWRPAAVLFLDCETTTDEAQKLTFGFYRYCRIRWNGDTFQLSCMEEGIFYADDLPTCDPDGFGLLQRYAQSHQADVGPGVRQELRFRSQDEFLFHVLYLAAYRARALVCGFNLPFDLSRLARHAGAARASRRKGVGDDAASATYRGGFSFAYWGRERDGVWHDRPSMPRIAIKSLDSKRALIGFVAPKSGPRFRGEFLDLRSLVFALTDKGHSLGSACDAFGVVHGKIAVTGHGVIDRAYVRYARRDVLATQELFTAVVTEYLRHPIDLSPTRAFSPAAIGKAYLAAMGVPPILERQPDFPKDVLGIAMNAYYGGRAECRIRRTPVPVRYCDFRSMYPTVCALTGIFRLLTAERIEVRDATVEVRRMLPSVTPERVFDPIFWKGLVGFVQIQPDGDVLPARARYDLAGQNWQIGLNPLHTDRPIWVTIADAVDAALLGGRQPTVLRAIRLVPKDRLKGLRPVSLGDVVRIDPRKSDFFRAVVEERARIKGTADHPDANVDHLDQFLKTLANATSYGIFAELNRRDLPVGERERVEVHGLDGVFETRTSAPEDPGAYFFAPIASVVTGAARLMLGLLERSVTDAGGTYAVCDTDSFAIVASRTGNRKAAIPQLRWSDVDRIRARFRGLSPYDDVVGDLIKLEPENFDASGRARELECFAISAKRYALFRRDKSGAPVLVKYSEHGLGHLLDPFGMDRQEADWMQTTWTWLLRRELGCAVRTPSWFGRPSVGQITVSSPTLWRPFDKINQGRSYDESVKPFNFILTTHVMPFGHPNGVEPERFHLVAPYEKDSVKWLGVQWTDRYSGRRFGITASAQQCGPGVARVKCYGEVAGEYKIHREHKSLAPEGSLCGPLTRGLLRRRPVSIGAVKYIGKEANDLNLREAGALHDIAQTLAIFEGHEQGGKGARMIRTLQDLPTQELVLATGCDRATVKRWKIGQSLPRRSHALRIEAFLIRRQLTNATAPRVRDPSSCAAQIVFCSSGEGPGSGAATPGSPHLCT